MFSFANLFHKNTDLKLKNSIAEFLKINPEKLDEFERAYRDAALTDDVCQQDNSLFGVNIKQANKQRRNNTPDETTAAALASTLDKITTELVAETPVLEIQGAETKRVSFPALSDGHRYVSNDDLKAIPEALRPQAAGKLMKVDINDMSYQRLMQVYMQYQNETNPEKRATGYHIFRQGLDILDCATCSATSL